MLQDTITIISGADIVNATIETGTSNPSSATAGRLFYRTDLTQLLIYNGTAWVAASGTQGVTSVAASGGSTGLSFSGSPITTSGTLTLSGTLALASGGTGATTQSGAANAILPSQTSASGQFLTSNGTNVSWAAFTGVTSVTGAANQITASPTTGNVVLSIPQTFAVGINSGANTITSASDYTLTVSGLSATIGNGAALALQGGAGNTNGVQPDQGGSGGDITITGGAAYSIANTYASNAASGGNVVISTGVIQALYQGSTGVTTSATATAGHIVFETNPQASINSAVLSGLVTSTPVEVMRILPGGQISFGSSGTAVGSAGQVLTANASGSPSWQNSTGGVTSIVGTANEVIASSSTGTVTLSLPQAIATTSQPTFAGVTITGTPTNTTDAATKAYVDATANGLSWKQAAKLATTVALSGTYVGSPTFTLTNNSTQAALSIDGVTVTVGQRILVKNQSTAASQNGIYVVTAVGSASANWVLTRSTDFNEITPIDEVNGAAVYVELGSTQSNSGWTQYSTVTTFDTSPISFTQFTGAGSGVSSIVAGTGISVSSPTGVVTVSNTGISSITGTAAQITASTTSGATTLSLPSTLTLSQVQVINQGFVSGPSSITIQPGTVNSGGQTGGSLILNGGAGSTNTAFGNANNGGPVTISGGTSYAYAAYSSGTLYSAAATSGNVIIAAGVGTANSANGSGGSATATINAGYIQFQVAPSLSYNAGVGQSGTQTQSLVPSMTLLGTGAIAVGTSATNYGTSGQVLTSAGSSAPPTWTTISTSPSLTATYVGYGNSSGSLTGSADFSWSGANDTSPTYTMTLGTATASPTIQAAASTTTASTLTINGSSASSQNGGAISIKGGNAPANGGLTGGAITIQGGGSGGSPVTGNYYNGGAVSIVGGTGNANNSSSIGGTVTIQSGAALATGGSATPGQLVFKISSTTNLTINTNGAWGLGASNTTGTAGQVLTQVTAGAAPQWATPTAGTPSQTSTYIGYGSTGGVLTGTSDFTWTESATAPVLTLGTPAATSVGTTVIQANTSNHAGVGQQLAIIGSTNSSGNGGNVNITGGTAAATWTSGYVNITGGSGTTAPGGNVVITGGAGSSPYAGGAVSVTGGVGANAPASGSGGVNGGGVSLQAGNGGTGSSTQYSGPGGSVTIAAGASGASGGSGVGAGGTIVFQVAATTALATVMTINNSGALGFGTSNTIGTAGQVLTTNSSGVASWATPTAGTPALTSTYVGYGNSSGLMGGSSDFTWSGGNDSSPTYTMTLGTSATGPTIKSVAGATTGTTIALVGSTGANLTTGPGYVGGAITITAGLGGTATGAITGAGNEYAGGAGGAISITSGTGGTGASASSGSWTPGPGGVGGTLTIGAGTGGGPGYNSSNVNYGTGGTGGTTIVTGGAGGASNGGVYPAGPGGAGGTLTLAGGVGGLGLGNGAGGSIVFQVAATTTLATVMTITNTGAHSFGTTATAYGTSGQVLTSNGNAAPSWQTVSSSAAAGTLTGTTLASNVVASSLTSVGALTSLAVTGNTTVGSNAAAVSISAAAGTSAGTFSLTGATAVNATTSTNYAAGNISVVGGTGATASSSSTSLYSSGGNATVQGGTAQLNNTNLYGLGGNLILAGGSVATFTGNTYGFNTAAGGYISLVTYIPVATTTTNVTYNNTAVERLRIENSGDWLINGTAGTSGQVLKSQGSGATPIWAAAPASPLTTGQIGYGVAGVVGGSTDFTYTTSTTTPILTIGNSSATTSTITSGGTTGGALTILGSTGLNSSYNGGNVNITGGSLSAVNVAQTYGSVNIAGGSAAANTNGGVGGAVTIASGAAGYAGLAGNVTITSGAGNAAAPAGQINLIAGVGYTTGNSTGGTINITAGAAPSTTYAAVGGSVNISTGISANYGSSGSLKFNTGTTASALAMTITPAGGVAFGTSATAYGTSGQVLQSNGNAAPTWVTPAAGNVGTVTSVSVVTANGISGTVATSTSTPAITLTLGAITPTTIAATGAISTNATTLDSTTTASASLTASTAYAIDTVVTTTFRTIKYIVQVSQGSTAYHSVEVLVLQDGTNCYKTEYGAVYSGGSLGTFDATISGSTMTLYFTPAASAAYAIKVSKLQVTV